MDTAPWLRRAAPWLAVSVALVAASLLAWYVDHVQRGGPPAGRPVVVRLLDVNTERNVPTAWSVALLLLATGVCLQGARSRQDRERGLRLGRLVLGALLLALALDEGLSVHERLGDAGKAIRSDALHTAWVVPGLVLAAVLALLALAALRRHDPLLRRRLVAAGSVYVLGAVVLETLAGLSYRDEGDRPLYVLLTSAEEGAEMTGLCLVLAALLLDRGTGPRGPARPAAGPAAAAPPASATSLAP